MSLLGAAGKLLPRALRERLVLGQIRSALRKFGLPREAEEKIMSGWKTWAAGIGMILGGAALIVKQIADGTFSFASMGEGFTMIMGGLGLLGIGHKVEKGADKIAEAAATGKTPAPAGKGW